MATVALTTISANFSFTSNFVVVCRRTNRLKAAGAQARKAYDEVQTRHANTNTLCNSVLRPLSRKPVPLINPLAIYIKVLNLI